MSDEKRCRYGIRSHKDVYFLVVLFINFLLWCCLYYRDRLDALVIAPVWLFVAVIVGVLIVDGTHAFKSSDKPGVTTPELRADLIHTTMMTVGDEFKTCIIQVSKDAITVFPSRVRIPWERLSQILVMKKSVVAGFSLDYTDHRGAARLMFVNHGSLGYRRTKKQVALIQEAHERCFAGCDVTPLTVVNLTEIEKARKAEVVHRDLGPL